MKEKNTTSTKLNWLRAAVLGANDGVVSIAALMVGVASAISTTGSILVIGGAGLIAGALSMSLGEYVSVSTQRDTEKALIKKEKFELKDNPEEELKELASYYEKKGLTSSTALQVANELTQHDPIRAHLDIELDVNPDELTNPWHAAIASAISFFIGGTVPLIAILIAPSNFRVPFTFIAVFIALVVTGVLSGRASNANVLKATIRVVIGGMLAMAITTGVGKLFGASGV